MTTTTMTPSQIQSIAARMAAQIDDESVSAWIDGDLPLFGAFAIFDPGPRDASLRREIVDRLNSRAAALGL